MEQTRELDIFLVSPPGLEDMLAEEARVSGLGDALVQPGGVSVRGAWPDIWRANLTLRGASRVLVRIGQFRAFHLAQLDKRARRFPWGDVLRRDVPVRVEATCRRSKIYHAGAAAQRVGRAIEEELGATVSEQAALRVLARIDDNLVTLSVDTSGEPLHRRGHKVVVGKAPLRETLAAPFLRQCGYGGSGPVVDPMCGSGTFVLEAAEMALGLDPGRSRSFAFEQLATFDAKAWAQIRVPTAPQEPPRPCCFGYDRDAGAISMAGENAKRAGVEVAASFRRQVISDLSPPDGPPGIVVTNPPYGGRIGNKRALFALYSTLGQVLRERFGGWRIGIVTSEPGLAGATKLPFLPAGPPVPNGGLRVQLYRTDPLA